MLEWEVVEEEEKDGEPGAGPASGAGKRRWRHLLVFLLLIALITGSGLWYTSYRQKQRLRADISEVIEKEARLMAVGARSQGPELVDPGTPADWQWRYYNYLGSANTLPGLPRIRSVELNEKEEIALVEVIWPHPEDAPAGRAVAERRAYRLVRGRWRRTALPMEKEPLESRESPHFLLRAAPPDLELLTEDPRTALELEALRTHLERNWPAPALEPFPITLIVKYQEFGGIVQKTVSRRTLMANSPRLNYVVSERPLSSAAYYRLRLTEATVRKLLPLKMPEGVQPEDEARYRYLFRQLQWAEARWWALDDEEHRELRNSWRRKLDGTWYPPVLQDPRQAEEPARQQLSMNLLIDTLVTGRGNQIIGRLAAALSEAPGEDPLALFAAAAETTPEALEAEARAYVRQME